MSADQLDAEPSADAATAPAEVPEPAAPTPEPGASRAAGLTLQTRLVLLLGISTAVLAIAGAILFSSLSTLGTERARVVRELDPAVLAARDLRTAAVDQETGVRGFVLAGEDPFLEPFTRGEAAEQAALADLAPLVEGDDALRDDVEAARRAAAAWRDEFAQTAIARVREGDAQNAREDDFQADGRARFEAVREAITQVEVDLNTRRDAAVDALDQAARRVWAVTIGALFGLIALGVVIVVALKRSVTDPIIELAAEVRTIADGDLDRTVSVEGTPELERLASDIDAMRLQILGELARLHDANVAIEQQALELERSNADLEQFAYVASHDLQEPLRKIAGFCQLLERRYKGQLDDRADEYIAFVVDGAHRMQDLINDLLSFSRVGRSTAAFDDIGLSDVVGEAVANLRSAIDDSGAEVDVAVLPTVRGDRRLLVALFQNLIGNAVKFRGDDPPVVRVTARADEPGGRWIVSVADNGIGIDAEYAEQIFTIFQRLHNRTDYEGTGIGLALAKKIAEYHDGAIWLDPDVDRGATFRITLPMIGAERAVAPRPDPDGARSPANATTVDAFPGAEPVLDGGSRSPQPAQEANP